MSTPRFAFSSRRSRRHMAPVIARSTAAGSDAAGSIVSPAASSAATAPKVGSGDAGGDRVVSEPAPPSASETAAGAVEVRESRPLLGDRGASATATATAPAAPANPAAAQGSPARRRDPRLGRWHDVGAFLMNLLREWEMKRAEVLGVAGLAPREDALRLLDYPGGLSALFVACVNEARRKQQREAVA